MQIKLKDGTMVDAARVDETVYNGESQIAVTLDADSYTATGAAELFEGNCDPMEVYSDDGETLLDTLTGYTHPRVQKHYEDDKISLTVAIFTK